MSDSPYDQLRANLEARTHAALAAPLALVARAREALDRYETALRTHTEGGLLAPVFVTLAVTPPVDPLPAASEALTAALHGVLGQIGVPLVPTVSGPLPVYTPPAPAPAAPASFGVMEPISRSETLYLEPRTEARPLPRAPIYPEPSALELEHARAFLEEMAETDFDSQHVLRLEPLLQALVADARLAMERIPPTHALHRRLDGAISRLGGLRRDLGVTGFVKGLSRDHRADWERVAREARRRVLAFDEDVEATTNIPPPKESKRELEPKKEPAIPKPEESHTSHEWPAFEALRTRLVDAPLFLVGGLRVEEKLTLVRDRFGLEPEWHEIYHGAPRATAAIAKRIRRGKIGAVVLLEGLTGHSNADEVVAACKASDVPFALADRAGSGSLQEAFDALDRQCRGATADE